jgi:outer membrane protein TolC
MQPVQPAPIVTVQPMPIAQPPIAQQVAPRPEPIVAAPVVAAPITTAPIVAAPVVGAPVTPLPQLAVRPESTKSFLPLVTLPSVVAASPIAASPIAAPPVAKGQVAKQPATTPVEPPPSAPVVAAQPPLQSPARVPQEVRAPMYVAAIEPAPPATTTETAATDKPAETVEVAEAADEKANSKQVATTPPVQKETPEKLPSIPPAPSILGALPPAPSLLGSTIETPLELRDAIVMALSQNKEIRVIQQTPQAVANDVTIANAFFDTKFGVGVYGGQDFRQLPDTLESFGAPITENRYDFLLNPERVNNMYLAKELRTGGNVEVGLGTDYERYDRFGAFRIVNPAWDSGLNFHIEQPLGAGRGRSIAELPIQIAYTNYVSQSFAVQGQINRVIRDVELAYWVTVLQELRLRRILSSVERASRLVQAEDKRLDLGDGTLPDVLGAKEQLFRFQQLAQEATIQAVTARVELNRLLGAPLDSQAYFTPVTEPDFSEPQLEWETACVRAIGRPEVRAQTAAYRTATLLLTQANNQLLPNVRAEADYRTQGLEDRLDDSFDTAGNFEYYRWGAGVFYETPIGRRAAHAGANKAKWIVSQQRARIDEVRQTIFAELASAYQQVALSYQNLSISRQRTAAANERVLGLVKLQENGKVNIDTILFAELRSIEADLAEADAMLVYERARVLWEYAQGRLLERWTLFVEPGACPPGFTDTEFKGQESQDAQLAAYAALTPSEPAKPINATPAKVEEIAALPVDEFRLLPTVQ